MQAAEAAPPGDKGVCGQEAVVASMRRHDIRFTAGNYAVWHAYLAGTNPALKRAIEVVLSNGATIDQQALHRLYTRHFCPTQGARALRQSAQHSLDRIAKARLQATGAAPGLLENLDEAAAAATHVLAAADTLIARLAKSEERVALLESYLNDATRDAATDSLTGLMNRRACEAALRSMAGEAMNTGADLAFILIDVDHFKRVNDGWGHAVGDDVLRHIAGLLTRTVRGGDLVARYGGEEFAIILDHTGQRGALSVAENLREAVGAHPFVATGVCLNITISAGLSCYAPGEPLGQWLARADEALYRAKRAGRNRVMFGRPGRLAKPGRLFASPGAMQGIELAVSPSPPRKPPDPPPPSCAAG